MAFPRVAALTTAVLMGTAACQKPPSEQRQAPVVQPGAPGQPSRERAGQSATPVSLITPKDMSFMQDMIHHHAQAIEMVELLKSRTDRADMKQLGQRIDISQRDEIKTMSTWLTDHGAPVPMDHGHGEMMVDGSMMAMMPGMLSTAQMWALEKARGRAFDRLFLEGMIQHHEGALVMVEDLLKSPGAGQDSTMFDFASHVDADQRMEIGRMEQMLKDSR